MVFHNCKPPGILSLPTVGGGIKVYKDIHVLVAGAWQKGLGDIIKDLELEKSRMIQVTLNVITNAFIGKRLRKK